MYIVSPTVLTASGGGQNYRFSAYLALKTAFYSFSRSKQAPVKPLLGASTRLGTLTKYFPDNVLSQIHRIHIHLQTHPPGKGEGIQGSNQRAMGAIEAG